MVAAMPSCGDVQVRLGEPLVLQTPQLHRMLTEHVNSIVCSQAVTFCGDKIISAGLVMFPISCRLRHFAGAEPAMYIWSRSGTLAR
eukprot:753476-Hanusia_phi.AAC.10